ncbi:MAG TPA: potassium channel family protein [Gaiellaceae bacterium]
MAAPLMRIATRRMARAFETGRILPYLLGVIALTAVAAGAIMRLVDGKEYPTVGRALWWSVQTVTTVGYGDVTPTQPWGRFVATVLMILAFAFLSLLTGTVASLLVSQRRDEPGLEERVAELERIVGRRPE